MDEFNESGAEISQEIVPVAETTPASETAPLDETFFVKTADLNPSPLASIPKWVWLGLAGLGVYLLWKKGKNSEKNLLEESIEE